MGHTEQEKKIKVWDFAIRFFHWLMVILVCVSWWTASYGEMQWHQYSGFSILGLVFFRILWGFGGTYTARFRHFIKGANPVIAYTKTLLNKTDEHSVGHNPLGGWSVLVLLLVLTTQVTSGLFAVDIDGLESGSLSYLVSFDLGRSIAKIHAWSFNGLMILVCLHIIAIFWHELYKKERLILPMITGYKFLKSKDATKQLSFNLLFFIDSILLSGAFVYMAFYGFLL